MRRLRLTPSLLLALAAACSPPEPARVVGDVYYATEPGKEIQVTGGLVRLLDDTEELDSALARVCVQRDEALARSAAPAGGAADREAAARSEVMERAWRERDGIVAARTLRSVRTDAAAHFAFDSVPPGRYRLAADGRVEEQRVTWLHPVRVRGGDTTRVDLNNSNTDENPLKCRW